MKKLVFAALTWALAVASGASKDVVFSDDFESASTQNPPPGWTMWGAELFKKPANYTRDFTAPHGGQACFRICHPAKTGGYIVSAPERAIRSKPAMIYSVTFWARADKPGKASFGWSSYHAVEPSLVDAPSPGFFPFDASTEWKEYTFQVREGLDFFADESRFLLLTFKATTSAEEERTLWIDDVLVSEQPDLNPVHLIADAKVPREPLQHRLEPGAELDLTVDANKRLRPATQDAGGVSFHRVCGWTGQPYDRQGHYTLAPELETAIREMHLPMTRFYGIGDEPFGVESSIDKAAEVCKRTGIAQDHCVLEFEAQDANTKLPPEVWAKGVSHSVKSGYGFHYWEIANEPYTSMWGGGKAFPTSDAFAEHFKAVSHAIRKADPKARIGFGICIDNVRWGNYLLKQLAGDYDYVVPHYYCGTRVYGVPFEELALTENYRKLDRALQTNGLMHAYNPGREVYQYDTEWGMSANTTDDRDPDYENRNANIVGTLHRAVRLIYYTREDILHGASGWQMFSGINGQGFGILSQEAPGKRFMLYWLYYYFNRHVGESVLEMKGTAPVYQPKGADQKRFAGPLTPALVTLSKDGRSVYLVIANGSSTLAVPARVHLQNFKVGSIDGILLTNDNLDAKPLLEQKADAISAFPVTATDDGAACTIPPRSVVFVTMTRK